MAGDAIIVRPIGPIDSLAAMTELLHSAYARLGAMGFNYTAWTRPRRSHANGLPGERASLPSMTEYWLALSCSMGLGDRTDALGMSELRSQSLVSSVCGPTIKDAGLAQGFFAKLRRLEF
jgi:hypothetical protein